MEESELRATSTDPLLACCLCRCLIRDAVQLTCLHNCCRQCFSTAASKGSSQAVCCGSCDSVTQAGSEQPNWFIGCLVQRHMSIADSGVCGVCKGNGEHYTPAVVWCPTCRHSLCSECMAGHRQYFRQHVTQSLEELESLDEGCSQPLASTCAIHKKPVDIACLNCEQAKCISCWAKCKESKHVVHVVGEESFDSYIDTLVARISNMESELNRKSEVVEKPKSLLRDIAAARDRHLEEISVRKRRIVDAVEMVYQEIHVSTKNAYDELEDEGAAATAAAERIACKVSDARNYACRLVESSDKCEIFKQQKIVRERLGVLSAELDMLSDRLVATMKKVNIKASLPETVEDVVRAWIGTPQVYSASSQQQQQCFFFGAASASLDLPSPCVDDIALTLDGRLLLAAGEHGLIELSCAIGRELSRWRPPKQSRSSSKDDQVLAVAALSDGRAAVSMHYAQLVVLLRRIENVSDGSTGGPPATAAAAAAASDNAWIEDRRLDRLTWSPRWLSAHGDVLAACECIGQRLQLLSVSSGRPLSAELRPEYGIGSLAVSSRAVVTGSSYKVKVEGGRRAAYVLDAHRLADYGGDKRLWRHVLSSSDNVEEEEELWSICADSCGGCLYVAVCRSDRSSGRLSGLSLADGSELRRVALSFDSGVAAARLPRVMLPMQLALSDAGAAAAEQQRNSGSGERVLLLAVLCFDPATGERRSVTLHRSKGDVLL